MLRTLLRSTPRTPSLRLPLACVLAALLAACGSGGSQAPDPVAGAPSPLGDDAPRLVLFLAIDQGAVEAMERYRPLLDQSGGGLAMLYDRATVFTDTHHAHAATETAPGHATLATGRHPSGHGIIANAWFDVGAESWMYSLGDRELGRSPRNILVPTLGDWLKAAAPGAKVITFSGKDRSAIAMAGHRGDAAFWYDRDSGDWVTTPYYLTSPPAWLEEFHEGRPADRWFGTSWEPLDEVAAAAPRLGVRNMDAGDLTYAVTFPHPLGSATTEPDDNYYGDLYRTPYLDRLTAEAALAAVDGAGLGDDSTTDLLAVSFSALDTVGHPYGPDSLEYLDTLIHLDRTLEMFFDGIDRRIGLDNVVVSLSADHGVLPVPEVMTASGTAARRLDVAEISCFQRVGQELDRRLGEARWLAGGGTELWVLPSTLAATGVERSRVVEEARDLLVDCPGVERVWTADELAAGSDDPFGRLYAHGFHPDRSPDLALQLEENILSIPFSAAAANHGSPYAYDTHVPWLLMAPGRSGSTVTQRVETVDVAPTVAELAGIPVPDSVDGTSRVPLLPAGR